MAVTGTTYDVVVGWTAAIDVDLRNDGQIPSSNLVGTVAFVLWDASGNPLTFAGTISILDAVNWRIRILPGVGDFNTSGVFRARVSVTDVSGRVAFFPNAASDVWIVH